MEFMVWDTAGQEDYDRLYIFFMTAQFPQSFLS